MKISDEEAASICRIGRELALEKSLDPWGYYFRRWSFWLFTLPLSLAVIVTSPLWHPIWWVLVGRAQRERFDAEWEEECRQRREYWAGRNERRDTLPRRG